MTNFIQVTPSLHLRDLRKALELLVLAPDGELICFGMACRKPRLRKLNATTSCAKRWCKAKLTP